MRRRSTLGERGDFVLLPTAQAPSRPSPRDLAVLDESLSADNALLKGVPRPAGIDESDSAPIGRFAASIADASSGPVPAPTPPPANADDKLVRRRSSNPGRRTSRAATLESPGVAAPASACG